MFSDKDSKPYCAVCCVFLPSDSQKAVKQHLKSKPHKDAQRQPVQELKSKQCCGEVEPDSKKLEPEHSEQPDSSNKNDTEGRKVPGFAKSTAKLEPDTALRIMQELLSHGRT